MFMTLNQLIYFQAIAHLEHFHQAAAELNISQPSLSRSIASLEEELNIILFERQGRNIRLTKYGKIFLEYVDRILAEVKNAESRMKQLSGNKGHVDIAYVFPLAGYYIPHMVRQFLKQKKNAGVTFSFHQLHTSALVAGLKKDKFDIIFSSYVENEPEIQFIPLINQEMVIITPLDHPLKHQKQVSLSDLENYPIIGYDKTSGLGRFTERLIKTHGLHLNIVCECPDEYAISALVENEFGIALVADVDAIHQRDIHIFSLSDHKLNHTVYLGHKKDRYMIPAVRNFIQFIRKEGTHL